MHLSSDEITDLLTAIEDARNELCVDMQGNQFPEGTAFARRLDALTFKFNIELNKRREVMGIGQLQTQY